ncbi:MAG: carbohydrate kinase family protein, partial [Planctomycetota bacterium]
MAPHDIDCLVLGTSGVDVVVRPVDLARPIGGGRLVHVEPLDLTTGGIVCNSGIALRTLGLEVAAAGLVGDDLWGRIVRERLADAGIDVVGIEPHPTEATSSSAVLVDPGGERSFAHHVGAPRATDMA